MAKCLRAMVSCGIEIVVSHLERKGIGCLLQLNTDQDVLMV